jgi:opacity protein-like surface antigen
MVVRMPMLSDRSAFAFALVAALWLGAPVARAQDNPVPYWTTAWPAGFGSGFAAAQSASTYVSLSGASLSALDGSGAPSGFSSRFDLPDGWFVGGERGGMALNGFSGAWRGLSPLSYEGTQVGYNFKNVDLPVSIYAGFGTLKYNTGFASPLPGFDSMSSANSPGYAAHVGVEFRPTSNLSLSVGASFAQQPQGYDTGINSLVAPGASPFAFGARR